mmetsp:Transcript_23039/g.75103  ORF Transcript_23039/g.75103 Transcript_23039/m.75103 type:complete len:262 (-) Transcript_23039:239-1024(-)
MRTSFALCSALVRAAVASLSALITCVECRDSASFSARAFSASALMRATFASSCARMRPFCFRSSRRAISRSRWICACCVFASTSIICALFFFSTCWYKIRLSSSSSLSRKLKSFSLSSFAVRRLVMFCRIFARPSGSFTSVMRTVLKSTPKGWNLSFKLLSIVLPNSPLTSRISEWSTSPTSIRIDSSVAARKYSSKRSTPRSYTKRYGSLMLNTSVMSTCTRTLSFVGTLATGALYVTACRVTRYATFHQGGFISIPAPW